MIPIKGKTARTIVCHLIERVFSLFGPPETLHSDQGKGFENELVKELQVVFGYKKTRTAPFRPQGNSVLERVHNTVHNMLAMYINLSFDNWAELSPFFQLGHNTAYSTTLQETPHFLMFGRSAVLPVNLILGVPSTSAPQTQLDYSKQTVENLQLAYELAHRNLRVRADKQAVVNEPLSFPSFKAGEQVQIHHPHNEADGSNPKLISPWPGQYTVRAQMSPVIHCVIKDGNPSRLLSTLAG